MRPRTRIAASAALVSALLATSACANIGLEPAPPAEEGMIAEIRMPSEAAGSVQGILNYNWLSPNATVQTWLFEPLMIRDRFTCEAIPWRRVGSRHDRPARTPPARRVGDVARRMRWPGTAAP